MRGHCNDALLALLDKSTHLAQMVYYGPVALQRIAVHSAHGDRVLAYHSRNNPKGSRGPVAFDRNIVRQRILLVARDCEYVSLAVDHDARAAHRIECHLYVRGTCQRACYLNLAILPCKRKGKEQSCKILRGYISRKDILSARQTSFTGKRKLGGGIMLLKGYSVQRQCIAKVAVGTLRQFARTHKCSIGTKHRSHRQEEAQRGTALATVERTALLYLNGLHKETAVTVAYRCSQGIEGIHCGNKVVVERTAGNAAGLFSQCRTDEQTVRLRF